MDGFKVSRMSFSFNATQWALRAAQRQGKGRDTSHLPVSLWLLVLVCPCGADIAPAVIASLLEAMCGQGGTLIVHGAKVGTKAYLQRLHSNGSG